jgi:AraC-like DNA-binding protein
METRFWRILELEQLECISVTASRHCFPRHFHETYVIEIVAEGRNEFWCDGHIYSAGPDDILVIHPGEIHTGYPAGSTSLSYRTFYPSKRLIAGIQSRLNRTDQTAPRFRSNVIRDRKLAWMLRQAHILTEQSDHKIAGQNLLILALKKLLLRHSDHHKISVGNDETDSLAVSRVKPALNFLAEKYHENVSLMELSAFCGLSEYHFLRTFKKSTGLAPYEYVIATRVEESRKLLSRGMSIAEAAARTGFCDQSHLNRHFKRILGITPGRYARRTPMQLDSMKL